MGFGRGKGFTPPVIPTPVDRFLFNSIEPQKIAQAGQGAWSTHDASKYAPAKASGLVVHCVNRDTGQERKIGLRKTGISHVDIGAMQQLTHTWAMVGLNPSLQWDSYAAYESVQDFWVMAWTDDRVIFLDEPVDFTPALPDIWTDCDVGSLYPAAKAAILDTGSSSVFYCFDGIQMKGSTDNRVTRCWHHWAIIGLNAEGKFQVQAATSNFSYFRCYLMGYITDKITCHTNGTEITEITAGSWTMRNLAHLITAPRWAVIEVDAQTYVLEYGLRKNQSLREIIYDARAHDWSFIHCDNSGNAEFYKESDNVRFYCLGEIE